MASPPSEVAITAELVSQLVRDQHPERWGPVTLVAHGWDCDTYRLGDELAVRLPRRTAGVPVVEREQRWLGELAEGLPIPIPAAVGVGRAGCGYPWPWTIVPWFDGRTGDTVGRAERDRWAEPLAGFLDALHRPAPTSAPRSSYRGTALDALAVPVEARLRARGSAAAVSAWVDAVTADPAPVATWAHGDLHPANVVIGPDDGIAAVIDFGDLCAGDPAVDVAAAWLFFTAEGRSRFRGALRHREAHDPHLWRRARGWAVAFSLGLVHDSDGSSRMTDLGRDGLAAVDADPL